MYIYTVYIIVVFSIYLYNLIYAWWMPAIYCIGQESDLQKRLSFEICIVHHLYMDMWRIAIICIYKGVYIYMYIYIYIHAYTPIMSRLSSEHANRIDYGKLCTFQCLICQPFAGSQR